MVGTFDGISVAYVDLARTDIPSDRVRAAEVSQAMRTLRAIEQGYLLAFSNRPGEELHLVWPKEQQPRPVIRRIVFRKNEWNRTSVEQLSGLRASYSETQNILQTLDEAFSVEPVSERFFKQYRDVFKAARRLIAVSSGLDDPEHPDVNLFTQSMFNRLLFVYFLSRKKWLKFSGETDYLNALWRDHLKRTDQPSFYETRLKPLFFDGLSAEDQTGSACKPDLAALIGDVPFLNGGLFDRDPKLDDAFEVPNGIFGRLFGDLFDNFNFTVSEATPYDVEVAVDPEMLGKVFEETVNARNENGAFYTPAPVVTFMCREALKGHIANRVPDLEGDQIRRLVDENDAKPLTQEEAMAVGAAVEEVKVVDPACGSGAYLLGMMHELIATQSALDGKINARTIEEKDEFALKLRIIRRNLYGADIDQFAVNIAMLRLWLSLAVDFQGDVPPPLPNLEYQIVCGDSLAAPAPDSDLFQQKTLELIRGLESAKTAYFSAFGVEKGVLRSDIERLESAIYRVSEASAPRNAVNWTVAFADVFRESLGFDVVISNPPYVRQERIVPRSYKERLLALYPAGVSGKSDLFCYFFARGIELLAEGGMHVFVCSNSWLDVQYGARLQGLLLSAASIKAVIDSEVEKQFSTANINTAISVISKTHGTAEQTDAEFVLLKGSFVDAISDASLRRVRRRSKSDLAKTKKWGGHILRAPDVLDLIVEKASEFLVPVKEVARFQRGKTTGKNDFFVPRREEAQAWGIEPRFLRPVMRYARDHRNLMVLGTETDHVLFVCVGEKSQFKGTKAGEYIAYGEELGVQCEPTCRQRKRWWDLSPVRESPLAFMYQPDQMFRTYRLAPDLACTDAFINVWSAPSIVDRLWASLNSAIAQVYLFSQGRANFGGGMIDLKVYEFAESLIPDPRLLPPCDPKRQGSSQWDLFHPTSEQSEVDDMVFSALKLSRSDRQTVLEGLRELVSARRSKARSRP